MNSKHAKARVNSIRLVYERQGGRRKAEEGDGIEKTHLEDLTYDCIVELPASENIVDVSQCVITLKLQ